MNKRITCWVALIALLKLEASAIAKRREQSGSRLRLRGPDTPKTIPTRFSRIPVPEAHLGTLTRPKLTPRRAYRLAKFTVTASVLAGIVALELQTSWLQSQVFVAAARRMTFWVEPSASTAIRYPEAGPYDERLGYSRLPTFLNRLQQSGYEIRAQARRSELFLNLMDWGVFPIYREKSQAGLRVAGRFPVTKEATMPVRKLREFLDSHDIKYVTISHSPAYTAQQVAASAHIPGKELAKTVMVRIDGKMAMAVLPASHHVDFDSLKVAAGATTVELATEAEFKNMFSECEIGAMPPFGNLYGMSVFSAVSLAEDEEIAFSAGSHSELIRLPYKDFERLVNPTVVKFSSQS